MFRRIFFVLICMATIAAFSGCNSNTPPPFLAPQHLYVTDQTHVFIYSLPVTAASTPVVTLPVAGAATMTFDASGRLFVDNQAALIRVFAQPITSSSTPLFTITATFGVKDMVIDAGGRLYAIEAQTATCCVEVFNPPFSGSSTSAFSLANTTSGSPWGGALDGAGDLFLADTTGVSEYAAPISSGSAPAHTFGSITNNNNFGIAANAAGDLFVANGAVNGSVDFYNAPYTNASTKAFAFVVTSSTTNSVTYLALDRFGNLYAANGADGLVDVFARPFSVTSTPVVKLPVTNVYGVAIGP
jgi:hypothetical protein